MYGKTRNNDNIHLIKIILKSSQTVVFIPIGQRTKGKKKERKKEEKNINGKWRTLFRSSQPHIAKELGAILKICVSLLLKYQMNNNYFH